MRAGLSLALPDGWLHAIALDWIERAKSLSQSLDLPWFQHVEAFHPLEVVELVEAGRFDVGITGYDWIAEARSGVLELAENTSLKGRVRIVLAVSAASKISKRQDLIRSTIVTEYPNLTNGYLCEANFHNFSSIVRSHGNIEREIQTYDGAVISIQIDADGKMIDTPERVRVFDTLLASSMRLITNRRSYEADKDAVQQIYEVIPAFRD